MGGGALKPKQYARLCQMRLNTKMQLSAQCRACGTIKILEYVNTLLLFKHKPNNFYFELSSK